jgi:hypothetical protein
MRKVQVRKICTMGQFFKMCSNIQFWQNPGSPIETNDGIFISFNGYAPFSKLALKKHRAKKNLPTHSILHTKVSKIHGKLHI